MSQEYIDHPTKLGFDDFPPEILSSIFLASGNQEKYALAQLNKTWQKTAQDASNYWNASKRAVYENCVWATLIDYINFSPWLSIEKVPRMVDKPLEPELVELAIRTLIRDISGKRPNEYIQMTEDVLRALERRGVLTMEFVNEPELVKFKNIQKREYTNNEQVVFTAEEYMHRKTEIRYRSWQSTSCAIMETSSKDDAIFFSCSFKDPYEDFSPLKVSLPLNKRVPFTEKLFVRFLAHMLKECNIRILNQFLLGSVKL